MPRRSELRLTKRTVDALTVQTKDSVFWDRDLAGFGVRVHATGRKAYVVQSRGPGGLKRVTLGQHGDLAADEARKRAAVIIDRIKRGEAPVATPPVPELTVAALAERYMCAHVLVHCKPSTAGTYRFVLDRHILPALGETAVGTVGRSDIAALHHQLRTTPTMANAAVDILSKMFSLAEAWDRVAPGRNPCRAVRRYKTRTRERFLTPEEFRRLGRVLSDAEADGSVWPPAIAAIRLLLLTGCRRSEILSLRWDDVDRTAGELRLRDSEVYCDPPYLFARNSAPTHLSQPHHARCTNLLSVPFPFLLLLVRLAIRRCHAWPRANASQSMPSCASTSMNGRSRGPGSPLEMVLPVDGRWFRL